ncbi:MAG: glycosyltransferase family 4 protein [Candidatus Omnitrophota bacterium]
MKIAMVVHTSYPEFVGGREHHVHYLASAISGNCEVAVMSGGRNISKESRVKIGNYSRITIPMISVKVSNNPLQIYRFTPDLFSLLTKEKPDLIHAFEYGSYTTDTAYSYCSRFNIPLVLTVYGYQFKSPIFKFLKVIYDHSLGKRLLKRADKIYYPSDSQRKEILRIDKIAVNKISRQNSCIDVKQFQDIAIDNELLVRYGLRGKFTLLTLARILPRKGIKFLILALGILIKEYKIENLKLLIVGPDCGELTNIKKMISKMDLAESVVITGTVAYDQVKSYLGVCDVFILPSLYEGLPLALIEAMAAGKAVIFSDLPCARDVIKDQENGLLVKPADSASLAEAILKLYKDRDLRDSLGRNAANKAQSFDYGPESRLIQQQYQDILANRQ